ncbi:S49 family peptidase [Myroides odoratimimus]|uniref:S49 family peptidase n=1 Tax=Myroides odoratimimus TaxID=76832 RepID=UPI0025783F26|nr:S49 family peptidase [Myroides odoratimimus]MDM1441901.1 S49 family peptidase [Myroides odoratimimus]
MINNLFSLLNTNWFIEPTMKNTLLPQLQNVLDGKLIEGNSLYPSICTSHSTTAGTKDNPTPNSEDQYVAVIPIKGGIYKYNQFCGPTGTQSIGRQIQQYDRDSNCIGIVLDIDSGGGQVSGTAELYDIITSISTPIETYTDGFLCSAAYYIASATKKITANKRADKIGSIGVMTYFIDLEGYYKSLGANVIEEYATKSTDKNKAIRELLNGNSEQWIREELDPIAEEFIADVKSKRKEIKEEVFTGPTYGPSMAQSMGLIDKLGTLKEVVNSFFSNSKNKDKQSESMSKKIALTALTGVLAVEALEGTDKGTYLNQEQLETINTSLEDLNTKLTEANQKLSNFGTSMSNFSTKHKAIAEALGVDTTEDTEANQTLVLDKIADLNKKPGNAHTTVMGNPTPPAEGKDSIVDMSAGHNQLLNEILK